MRRYWLWVGMGLLAAGLAAGVTLAAMGQGGPPPGGGDGQGMAQGGQRPGRGPGPMGPPRVVPALEAAMGNPMTDVQRRQVAEAAKAMHERVRAAHEAFVQRLAEVTGLSVERIREVLPPPPVPPPPPPQGEKMGPPPGGQGPPGGDQTPPPPGGRRGPPRGGKGPPPPGGIGM